MSDIADALHGLLHAYKRALQEAYREREASLTPSYIRTLKCIAGFGECTAQTIASELMLDKAQVARALRGLVDDGYVERREHPTDGRSYLLVLTRAGKDVHKRFGRIEREAAAKFAAGIDDTSLRTFVEVATEMVNNANEDP